MIYRIKNLDNNTNSLLSLWGNTYSDTWSAVTTDNSVVYSLELPGVREGDFEVSYDNNILTVSGNKRTTGTRFTSSTLVVFDSSYNSDKLSDPVATFEDCILTVHFNIVKPEPKVTKIKVNGK
jgi:HSP20 family molecular chaperone IbpA